MTTRHKVCDLTWDYIIALDFVKSGFWQIIISCLMEKCEKHLPFIPTEQMSSIILIDLLVEEINYFRVVISLTTHYQKLSLSKSVGLIIQKDTSYS